MSTKLHEEYENVSESHWLHPTLQRIRALPFHTDNWSTGARRTDPLAANQLIEVLEQILPNEAPPPSVVPTWLGGAQAEWHRNGVDLEISVNPGDVVECYFNNGNEEWEGVVAIGDWADLKEYARIII